MVSGNAALVLQLNGAVLVDDRLPPAELGLRGLVLRRRGSGADIALARGILSADGEARRVVGSRVVRALAATHPTGESGGLVAGAVDVATCAVHELA